MIGHIYVALYYRMHVNTLESEYIGNMQRTHTGCMQTAWKVSVICSSNVCIGKCSSNVWGHF